MCAGTISFNMLNFLIHLRLHYQFFILSGGYLMGGLLVAEPDWYTFWFQFINVHVLLFGGATAFNSWHDKDEGPIGGLQHPPKMNKWMRDLSLIMQFAGLFWAFGAGPFYSGFYLISMLLFWLYSTPLARWKGRPLLSLVAIGISTGTNSLIMGALAAGAGPDALILFAGVGTGFMILSLYPVSQIYQIADDRKRGDITFASEYGLKGVRRFNALTFILGVAIITFVLYYLYRPLSIIFLVIGITVWLVLISWIRTLSMDSDQYNQVMKIKYLVSGSFVLFIVTALMIRHL
jgi:4-hydroxybenzoate polyprenyltransferase